MLGCAAAVAHVTAGYVYQWLLPLVSILSLVAIMVAVHPASVGMRRILSWPPLVEIGKRSYGLYLWSWPIFVIFGATEGSRCRRSCLAMIVTVVVTEASYRCLETPVRKGAIGDWWSDRTPDATSYAPLVGGALRARLSGRVLRERRAVRTASRAAARRRSSSTRRRDCSGAGSSTVDRGRRAAVDVPSGRRRRADHGRTGPDDRSGHVGDRGDRRRLAGARVGDQPARRDRDDVPERARTAASTGAASTTRGRRERPPTSRTTSLMLRRLAGRLGGGRRPATMSRSSCSGRGTCST